ncbi:hypothetical protein [Thermodesulfatator autotrophicus]|uniref:Uncharacterized protein n=1 Tax=Thermodesulfatator autotrophicus TaxID=1795632 RepID=A0A177E758_9BACT|nr:hypothetical protein [Thermodesulfatator autotrophicus]OAG27546.1 hypothetical protein TH606_06565 [Thermodesulfatator autotrophicus]
MRKVLSCFLLVAWLLVPMVSRAADPLIEWGVGLAKYEGQSGPSFALGVFAPVESGKIVPGTWIDAWFTNEGKGGFLGQGLFVNLADYVSFRTKGATLSERGFVLGLNAHAGLRYVDPEGDPSFLAPALHLGLGASGQYAKHLLFAEAFCETATRGGPVWGAVVRIPF